MPSARLDPFDPPSELRSLREQHPILRLRYPDGHLGWLVTSHELARAVLGSSRFSMRPQRAVVGDHERIAAIVEASPDFPEHSGMLIALDPPDHTRLRRLAARALAPRTVDRRRAALERIVADVLDAVERSRQPVDLVATFALPVSSLALCELLGIPPFERDGFVRPTAIEQDPGSSPEQVVAAKTAFAAYCRALVSRKRVQPGPDVVSELARDGELGDDELTGLTMQLLAAGQDTTANTLAVAVFALLVDVHRWNALRADLTLLDTAVDELVRYLTVLQLGAFTRTALADVELGGMRIAAGDAVTVSLSAANRDPGRFPAPEELDLGRDARGHLGFGYGRHMCVGRHFARLVLRTALRELVRRLPSLRLAVDAVEIPINGEGRFVHGIRRLPVAW